MLTIKSRQAVVDTVRNYVREKFSGLDISTRVRSYFGGITEAAAHLNHDFLVTLKDYADNDPFPQTARAGFLFSGWWSPLTGLARNQPTPAKGVVVLTGDAGTILVKGAELTANGITYETVATSAILAQSLIASSLTYDADAGLAIFETASPHLLATGMTLTISGANEAGYNGDHAITVTAGNEFTFALEADPGGPATGAPKVSGNWGNVTVQATTPGQDTNIDGGNTLPLIAPPVGMDGTTRLAFDGIEGGTDLETPESFRERILFALGLTRGAFTGDEVVEVIRENVPGVTRVFLRKASLDPEPGYPYEGQVRIAFLRDNDANPFPSAQEVATVHDVVVSKIMTAHTAAEDVEVISMTPKPVDFVFTDISPNRASMRIAIVASLRQFFAEQASWGGTIEEEAFRCAIRDSYDPETRQKVKSFTLSAPAGDIVPTTDEFPTLGSVTFD